MKKKILLVGSNTVGSIDIIYYKHLKNIGYNIGFFEAENIFSRFYYNSVFNKIIFKAGIKTIYDKISIQLKNKVQSYKPDIIWVFKGMSILPEFLEWAKSRNIKLVNYNADNPFIFTGKGSGNINVTNSISLYDLHLTYNLQVQKKIEEKYKIATGYLPFGFEKQRNFKPITLEEEINKLCFIGNPDKQRVFFLKKLLNNGVRIDVYGIGWNKFLRHKNASIYPAVYNEDLLHNLKRYRIQLNIMRIHNLNSHNMRTFEIPAVGGIMLAPDTTEHHLFFEDKKELFLYKSFEHCIDQILFLKNLSLKAANTIRENAYKRCLVGKYSYKDRAEGIISLILE